MKIAFVMPWHISERGGGSEVQANYLAQELALRGHCVSYICQTENKSKINSSERINGFEVFWLKSSGRFAWLDQNKYRDKLQKINPDVVLQRMTSNVTYIIGEYCRLNHKIFHWFCTDNEVAYKNWHLKKFNQRFKFTFRNGLKFLIFYLNARILDFYRDRGMRAVNVAWSQNNFQKERLLQDSKLETHTMISGHPLPQTLVNSEENFNQQTVLWCANLGIHKRPELFIELATQMQHTNLKFVIVGGHSNQAYVDQLFLNQPSNLTTYGKCSFDEALSFFDSSSVFINTSNAGGDGFPNTFIQAWLRGVPTLTLGFDPDSVVVKNELGYTCSSVKQLAQKLQILLNSKEKYVSMSQNVKRYAEQHHSIKVMTDNFLKHLSE